MNSPGERLAYYIDYKKVELKIIAEKTGLSYNNFTSALKGKRSFGMKIIRECKKVFPNMNANWVLFGEGNPEINPTDLVNENISQYGLSKESDPEKLLVASLKDFIIKTTKEVVSEDISELQEDLLILFRRGLEKGSKGKSSSETA